MRYWTGALLSAVASLPLSGAPTCVKAHAEELGAEERSTATLVLSGIRDSRERIRSGEALANGVFRSVVPDGGETVKGDVVYRFVFDFNEGLQRFDSKGPYVRSGSIAAKPGRESEADDEAATNSGFTAFDSKFVRSAEWTLRWSVDAPRTLMRGGPAEPSDETCKLVDFRALGLMSITDVRLGQISFADVLDTLEKKKLTGVHDHGNGLFQLTWIEGKGEHVRRAVWFDQQRGFSPVRIELWDDRHSGEDSIQTGETLWEKKSGVWLPVSLHLKASWPIEEELSLALTWRNINGEVDRALFTPEGLNLPERTQYFSRELGSPVLLGEVSGKKQQMHETALQDSTRESNFGLRLFWLGLPLAFLAILGIWFTCRGSRTPSDSK